MLRPPRGETCPVCGAAVERALPTYPFCGERCRTIDLGNWLGESYRIPLEDPGDGDDGPDLDDGPDDRGVTRRSGTQTS